MNQQRTTDNGSSGSGGENVDAIPIRPNEFAVPPGEPFKNDLLERRPVIEGLTRMVGSARSPYVISVDADWGSGKTAFLNMWCQHLQNEGYTVVQFNAWETDFADSPFQALSAEVTHNLECVSDSAVKEGIENLKGLAANAAVALSKSALRGAGTLFPGAGPMTVEVLIKAIESLRKEPTKDPISEYEETRVALEDFRSSIGEVATAESCRTNGKPLVVAIDELDRCRPTYAIELIETAKHIFLVKNVVFILAINSTALAHSVKSLYGAEFDAERYFRRFFDLPFRLPEPNREMFAKELLASTKLQEMIRSQPEVARLCLSLAISLFGSESLSLRDAEQAARRLDLILNMLDDVKPWTVFCALIGLSIMVFRPDVYVRFLRGELTDEEVFEVLSSGFDFRNSELASFKPQIEAAVIALTVSRSGERNVDPEAVSSRLIVQHRNMMESNDNGQGRQTPEQRNSQQVLEWFSHIQWGVGVSDLIEAMRCLELVLPSPSSESE